MSGHIDLLGKILSVYGNDEKKIPGIFRQGFVDLRKQVESSYNEIIRETQVPPLKILASFAETLTRANIIKSEDVIESKANEQRGTGKESTILFDWEYQEAQWFRDHIEQLMSMKDIVEEEKNTVVVDLINKAKSQPSKLMKKIRKANISIPRKEDVFDPRKDPIVFDKPVGSVPKKKTKKLLSVQEQQSESDREEGKENIFDIGQEEESKSVDEGLLQQQESMSEMPVTEYSQSLSEQYSELFKGYTKQNLNEITDKQASIVKPAMSQIDQLKSNSSTTTIMMAFQKYEAILQGGNIAHAVLLNKMQSSPINLLSGRLQSKFDDITLKLQQPKVTGRKALVTQQKQLESAINKLDQYKKDISVLSRAIQNEPVEAYKGQARKREAQQRDPSPTKQTKKEQQSSNQ